MFDAWTRRRLLGIVGTVAAAGCLDTSDATESDEEDPDGDGSETNESDDGESSDGAEPDETDDETEGEEPTVHENYEATEVRVVSSDGDERGSVTAAIADTDDRRELGLGDTEDLPADRGMLFVFESAAERTFVMREMNFGIDIVYADADGVITGIHHAEQPEPGESGEEPEHRYPGRGQYVLEVNYEWTTDRGVSEGDVLEFDLEE